MESERGESEDGLFRLMFTPLFAWKNFAECPILVVNIISDYIILSLIISHIFANTTNICVDMLTSSNKNIFRVTGLLCGNWFPSQRPVARSLDVFFEQTAEQTLETLMTWKRHCVHYDVTVMDRGIFYNNRLTEWLHTSLYVVCKYSPNLANSPLNFRFL